MSHTCHALGCRVQCPPTFLCCPAHWRMVPRSLQREVWGHYRDGQCADMDFSPEWHLAATRAINFVAVAEGKMTRDEAERRLEHVRSLHQQEGQ